MRSSAIRRLDPDCAVLNNVINITGLLLYSFVLLVNEWKQLKDGGFVFSAIFLIAMCCSASNE